MKHTGHKTTFHTDNKLTIITEYKPKTCKACQYERKVEKELAKNRLLNNLNHSEPFNCNKCGQLIGYVSAFDLEGSMFFCKKCKKERVLLFAV